MNFHRAIPFAVALAAVAVPAVAAAGPAQTVPVHGVVVGVPAPGRAIVRFEDGTAAPRTVAVTVASPARLRAGETIDAFATGLPGAVRLDSVAEAAPFIAGLPNALVTHILAPGDPLPAFTYVDQRGRRVRFADFRDRVLVLSFVFTRCPDRAICPAISGKFSYMQHHLDPKHYHLVLVTLDPPYDTPAVLQQYGRTFAAAPQTWSLLTGQASQVKTTLDEFGISSISDRPGNYVHDDQLVLVNRDGRIERIIPTAGWNPDDVLAEAQNLGGDVSNPLRRFELASIAGIAAVCGGSQSTAVVVLDSAVFLLGVAILGGLLAWWGRVIFKREPAPPAA